MPKLQQPSRLCQVKPLVSTRPLSAGVALSADSHLSNKESNSVRETDSREPQIASISCFASEDVLSAPHIRHAVSTEGQPLYNSTYSWRCNVEAHVAAQAIDVVLFKSLSDQSRQSSPFTYHLPKALESGGRSMSAELILELLSFFMD